MLRRTRSFPPPRVASAGAFPHARAIAFAASPAPSAPARSPSATSSSSMRHASLHPLVPFRLTPFGLAFAFPPRGCSAGVWSPASSSSVRLRARLPFLPLPALADTSPPLRAPALSAASSAHAGSSTRPCMPSTGLPHGSSPTTSTAAPPSAPPSSPAPLPSSASFLCSLLVRSRPGSLHLLPPFTLPPPVQDFSQPWGGAAVSSTLLRLPLLAATAAARVMVSMPSLAILARLPGFTRPVGTPAVPGPVEPASGQEKTLDALQVQSQFAHVLKLQTTRPFDGKDFFTWSFEFELMMEGAQILGFFDGSLPYPTHGTQYDKQQYTYQSMMAYTILLRNITPIQQQNIRSYRGYGNSAELAYNHLKNLYQATDSVNQIRLMAQLTTVEMKPGEKGMAYISRCRELRDKLLRCRGSISEDAFVTVIIGGLGPQWRSTRAILRAHGKIPEAALCAEIHVEQQDMDLQEERHKKKASVPEFVFHTQRRYNNNNRHQPKSVPPTPRRESLQPNPMYAAIAQSEPSGKDTWFLDSCCGQHMCSSGRFVQREHLLQREVVITVANNMNLRTRRQGIVKLQSRETNVILQMSKVLIAEGLGYNLLSDSQLMAKGIHLEADSTTQEFKLYHGKGGLYIGKAVLKNNVFVLDFVPDLGTADSDGIVTFTSWTHPPDLDPNFNPEGFWYSHTIPEAERTRALATIQHSAAAETTSAAAETTSAAEETTSAAE
ncbi:unnamed protein product [Closterium sp. NIES-54]